MVHIMVEHPNYPHITSSPRTTPPIQHIAYLHSLNIIQSLQKIHQHVFWVRNDCTLFSTHTQLLYYYNIGSQKRVLEFSCMVVIILQEFDAMIIEITAGEQCNKYYLYPSTQHYYCPWGMSQHNTIIYLRGIMTYPYICVCVRKGFQ